MAIKKTKKKAEINIPQTSNKTLSKREKNKVKKTVKSFGAKSICLFVIVCLLGVALGAGLTYVISKNDDFLLLGEDEIWLTTDEKYYEDGYKVINFGIDMTDKVEIETDLAINSDGSFSPKLDDEGIALTGTYFIKYKAKTFKYSILSSVERIRLITFVEPSDDIEV